VRIRVWLKPGRGQGSGQGGVLGRVQAGGEAVDRLARTRQLREFVGELHDALPELRGALTRDPGVAGDGAQVVSLVRGGRLGGGGREVVGEQARLVRVNGTDVEDTGRPAVVPLVDRADSSRPHHLEHPGVRQQAHVVGHGAPRTGDGDGQLAHRRRPLQEQLEKGAAQRVGHRAQFPGRGDDTQVLQVVVGGARIVRHLWIVPLGWIDRYFRIIAGGQRWPR
jgi:hypothetical protein